MSTLPSHRGKLVQAQRHLSLLRNMSESLPDSDAYAVFTERDPETGEIVVYGEPRRETPMLTWGVVIGDIVHNLRSALDHMVWALTEANQPEPAPNPIPREGPGSEWKDIGFPIHTEPYPPDGSGGFIPWRSAPQKKLKKLWGIQPSLREEFERLQPFTRKENPALVRLEMEDPAYAPLTILNELWNIDKHRHLHLAVFNVGYKDLFDPSPHARIPKGIDQLNFALAPKGSFEGRTEFGRLSWDGGPVPQEIARCLRPTVFFDIAFGDGPPAHGGQVIQTLEGLSEEVRRILQKFEPHLA